MKKNLLTMFFVGAGLLASAQTRMSLYEEFTGENCNPCAATNPGLNALLSQPANAAKCIAIKWQVPIPSAPSATWSLYQTDITEIDARWKPVANGGYGYLCASCSPTANYINYAPQGRMDGQELTAFGITGPAGSQNHPFYLTSAAISAAQSVSTPFSINISPAYNANLTNAVVSVTVQSSAAFSTTAALVYRLVLVERTVNFATPSGSNGEKDFYDPVRKSYPNITSGTALPNTWTIGQTQTFTVNCPIPTYIHDLSQMAFVGFIQDEGSHVIWQAARSSQAVAPNDAQAISANVSGVICSTTVTPTATIKNVGSNAITAFTVSPTLDASVGADVVWTGNLAAGASTTIPLNMVTLTQGAHSYSYNITSVSGGEINPNNNKSFKTAFVCTPTYFPGPVTEPFATATFPPTNWNLLNADGGTYTWSRNASVNGYGSATGTGAAKYDFYNNGATGDADELYLPATDLTAISNPSLTFDVAYAFYTPTPNNENDQLEVKISTNCGNTWSTIFSQAGTALSTAPNATVTFVPSASQWKTVNIPLAAYANNPSVLVKFVATTDYGNNMYVDNINLSQSIPTGIKANFDNSVSFDVYPNPTRGETNVKISAATAGKANLTVINTLGQVVYSKQVELTAGVNDFQIDAKDLSSGLYSVTVESQNGSMVKKLTVAK